MLITKPGMYAGLGRVYHEHITPEPCLHSSGAKQLIWDCPAKYFAFAAFNEDRFEQKDTEAKVFGRLCHQIRLHGDCEETHIVLGEDETLRGKRGAAIRAQAEEEGKEIARYDDYVRAQAMRGVVEANNIAMAALKGVKEPSLFWKDPEFDIWLAAQPDALPEGASYLPDFKSAASAHPDQFAKAIWNFNYYQQAAWYLDGLKAVTGEKRNRFAFIVQEKEPPYLVSVIEIEGEAIEEGRILNRKAKHIFAECLERDHWPGYVDGTVPKVTLPSFAKYKLGEMDARGDLTVPEQEEAA